jgi:hypothetical protein
MITCWHRSEPPRVQCHVRAVADQIEEEGFTYLPLLLRFGKYCTSCSNCHVASRGERASTGRPQAIRTSEERRLCSLIFIFSAEGHFLHSEGSRSGSDIRMMPKIRVRERISQPTRTGE